ncbi:MAG: tRNA pseudouridine(38-40) synthase TruA [Bacteroidia bacterium]|nr:tRNA pseudouridine(38-40) synthase TruA [Bacteroidia bacterium]
MQRYFIQLSYDGTNYHGWQIQPNGISVQETIEKVLSVVAREAVSVTGAGRTDAGVHASFYVAHFDTENLNLDNDKIIYNLNCLLPADVAIQCIYKVNSEAHARFDALSRTYKYYLIKSKDPFSRQYAEKEARIPDLGKMNKAACKLFNYEDFTSFSRLGTDVKTNNCKVDLADWIDEGNRFVFTIRADRFLRNMVRAIVGTLLEVGFGKLTVDDFCKVIEAKDRCAAGASVPAKGLFLVDIGYPEELSKGLIKPQKAEN